MYEQCTDRFRQVMKLAPQEARQLGHGYVGTEHILLGLMHDNSGVAASALKNLGIDFRKVNDQIRLIVIPTPGPLMSSADRLPLTPRSKKVVEYALEECRKLNHNYAGTEHLLLGLLRETDGVAGQVLRNLGMKLNDARAEVLKLLGDALPEPTALVQAVGDSGTQPLSTTDVGENPPEFAGGAPQMKSRLSPGRIDLHIRQAVQLAWLNVINARGAIEEVETQVRRIVERALRDFREDHRAFDPGGLKQRGSE